MIKRRTRRLDSAWFKSMLGRVASIIADLRELAHYLTHVESGSLAPLAPEVPSLEGVHRVVPWLLGEAGILAVAPGKRSSEMEVLDESSLSDLTHLTDWAGDLPEIPMPVLLVDLSEGFFQIPLSEASPQISYVPVSPEYIPPSPLFFAEGSDEEEEDDHHSEWSTEAVVFPRAN